MDLNTAFSLNLKKFREASGMSQAALAQKSKTQRVFISDIESKQRNASLKKVQLLADALEVEPIDLLITENDRRRLMGAPFVGVDGAEYSLCCVDGDGHMGFSSLAGSDDDLSTQVVRKLLCNGYTGNQAVEVFDQVMRAVERLLDNADAVLADASGEIAACDGEKTNGEKSVQAFRRLAPGETLHRFRDD